MAEVPQVIALAWGIVRDAAFWMMLGFAAAGAMREFGPATRLQRALGRPGARGLAAATLLGASLPMCSCGSIPLGVGLYLEGAPLGNALAFMAANPFINPAAVILSYGLLGRRLTLAYVLAGLIVPAALGGIANRLGRPGQPRPGQPARPLPAGDGPGPAACGCCGGEADGADAVGAPARGSRPSPWPERVRRAFDWGFFELAPTVSRYVIVGAVLTACAETLVPRLWLQRYLGDHAAAGLLAVAALSSAVYVCAVGFIPVAASLLRAGAAPGTPLVFLMAGAATNLPELISIARVMGRRAAAVYCAGLLAAALALGAAVDRWLSPGFVAPFRPLAAQSALAWGGRLYLQPSGWLSWTAAWVLVTLGLYGLWQGLAARRKAAAAARAARGVALG